MHQVSPLHRSRLERAMHAVIFEVVANILVFIILMRFAAAAPAQSGVLTLVSSAVAMGWNYLFNWLFDALQARLGFRKGLVARCLNALAFEAGLLLVLIPFAAWWLAIALPDAFRLECGLVLFFLAYALAFNLLWDCVRDYRFRKSG